ncbi:MAG: murein biosynthesis integral membrane protein MurJ [Anaerolineae bacterium]|nr:murein biosynthesis integral membrane protein MurJ [Anaerolineae bacterium]
MRALDTEVEVAQAAGIIALGNVTSRVLGLVREMVKAGLFGATGSVGALEVAMRVPTLVYDFLVGGIISSALVPVLSDYTARERQAELWHLVSTLLSLAVVVLSAVALIGEWLAPQLVWAMAGGYEARFQEEAIRLLRVMLPAVVFLNIAGIVSGTLYALKRFTLPAFTAAAYNFAIVVLGLLLGRRLGVMSMALGLLVGAICQVVLQWPGLRDIRIRFVLDVRHPALVRIAQLYVPIALGLVVDSLGVVLSYNLASRTGASSIPWMQYSATLIQFPLGLVSLAVSSAILPTLSRQATNGYTASFKTTLAQGLRLVLVLTIPATVGLWVLATPIVALVFEHGGFTGADTLGTVAALRYHLVGLIFAAVDQPLIFAFYARKDTWTPALVGALTVGLYVLMAVGPTLFIPLTLNGLILANSLKWAAHALIMLTLLQRAIGGLEKHGIWELILKATGASLVMGALVSTVANGIGLAGLPGLVEELLQVALGGLVGVAVYGLTATLLGVEDIHLLRAALLDWAKRLTPLRQQFIMHSGMPRESKQSPSVRPELYDESYFLSACEGYEEFVVSEGAHLSRRLKQAFEVAAIGPGMRVLDVGCGRGEILRRCTELGVEAYGVDFAPAALYMARSSGTVCQANARWLPFTDGTFDRVLMFDLVEHLYPRELDQALAEARRVLRPSGRLVIHTAPNVWYDKYAYPLVRLVRTLLGEGERYPKDPRAIVPANLNVHVNEQSVASLRRVLRRAGFHVRVWLDTPPQQRRENVLFRIARYILFNWPPFNLFFEREVFAVAWVDERPPSG